MHTTCWRPNNSCATPILPFCRMHFSRSPLWTCNCFTRWFASHRAHILFCSLQQNHIMNEQQVGQNWFLSTPPFPSFPLLLSSISSSLLFVTALLLLFSISFLVIPTFDCCVIKSSKYDETNKISLGFWEAVRLHICLPLERREEESVLHDMCHDPSSLTLGRRRGEGTHVFYGRNRSYLYSLLAQHWSGFSGCMVKLCNFFRCQIIRCRIISHTALLALIGEPRNFCWRGGNGAEGGKEYHDVRYDGAVYEALVSYPISRSIYVQ